MLLLKQLGELTVCFVLFNSHCDYLTEFPQYKCTTKIQATNWWSVLWTFKCSLEVFHDNIGDNTSQWADNVYTGWNSSFPVKEFPFRHMTCLIFSSGNIIVQKFSVDIFLEREAI